jgi:hypothetical protein
MDAQQLEKLVEVINGLHKIREETWQGCKGQLRIDKEIEKLEELVVNGASQATGSCYYYDPIIKEYP